MIKIIQSTKKFPCDFCGLNSTSMVLKKEESRSVPIRICNSCIDDLSELLSDENKP